MKSGPTIRGMFVSSGLFCVLCIEDAIPILLCSVEILDIPYARLHFVPLVLLMIFQQKREQVSQVTLTTMHARRSKRSSVFLPPLMPNLFHRSDTHKTDPTCQYKYLSHQTCNTVTSDVKVLLKVKAKNTKLQRVRLSDSQAPLPA